MEQSRSFGETHGRPGERKRRTPPILVASEWDCKCGRCDRGKEERHLVALRVYLVAKRFSIRAQVRRPTYSDRSITLRQPA